VGNFQPEKWGRRAKNFFLSLEFRQQIPSFRSCGRGWLDPGRTFLGSRKTLMTCWQRVCLEWTKPDPGVPFAPLRQAERQERTCALGLVVRAENPVQRVCPFLWSASTGLTFGTAGDDESPPGWRVPRPLRPQDGEARCIAFGKSLWIKQSEEKCGAGASAGDRSQDRSASRRQCAISASTRRRILKNWRRT